MLRSIKSLKLTLQTLITHTQRQSPNFFSSSRDQIKSQIVPLFSYIFTISKHPLCCYTYTNHNTHYYLLFCFDRMKEMIGTDWFWLFLYKIRILKKKLCASIFDFDFLVLAEWKEEWNCLVFFLSFKIRILS